MASRSEALAAAEELLQSEFGQEKRTERGDQVVVLEDDMTEYETAWLVPFNSRIYVETGNPVKFLMPGACLVPKDGVVAPHFPPPALPVEEYLDKVWSGEMDWLVSGKRRFPRPDRFSGEPLGADGDGRIRTRRSE